MDTFDGHGDVPGYFFASHIPPQSSEVVNLAATLAHESTNFLLGLTGHDDTSIDCGSPNNFVQHSSESREKDGLPRRSSPRNSRIPTSQTRIQHRYIH